MTYAAESYAQKTMISLEVRNETVGTVLEKLKKESGFDFFFNNKHVDLKRIVSVSANNNNIFKILDQIFAGTNVKYSVLEKKIILSTEIVQGIQQGQRHQDTLRHLHNIEAHRQKGQQAEPFQDRGNQDRSAQGRRPARARQDRPVHWISHHSQA